MTRTTAYSHMLAHRDMARFRASPAAAAPAATNPGGSLGSAAASAATAVLLAALPRSPRGGRRRGCCGLAPGRSRNHLCGSARRPK